MARSAAGMQEAQQEEDKKKKAPQSIADWFNRTIDLALTHGRGWSVKDIEQLEGAGRESRGRGGVRGMAPAKTERIAAAVPKREAGEMQMTRPAIQAALKLAETFETARTGQSFRLDAWINAGRMA